MPEVLIRCPVTKKQLSTGLSLSPEAFARADLAQTVRCPHCGLEHAWTKRDAYLYR